MAQNRLVEIENALTQMQSQQQSELIQMEAVLQEEIAVKLTAEVAVFSDGSGLDVVLNWGRSGEGVLFGGQAFGVTSALIQFMNDRYVPTPDLEATENDATP